MCSLLTAEVANLLKPVPSGKTLIITVGNAWRSDDGVAPYIAARVDWARTPYLLLDAGDRPENILEEAVGLFPAKVLILDAADFGGCAGEASEIAPENIPDHALSTHAFPLTILAQLLRQDTGAPVHFVGIQPRHVGLGEGLSPEVQKTADALIAFFQGA